MVKQVVLVTGTPCVGKTSVSRLLASRLDGICVNLTDLAKREGLILGKDVERDSMIVDENLMKRKIREIIASCDKKAIVIDGHYAVNVVPRRLATKIFVLRRDPVELRRIMENCGFSDRKLWENLASEILDVCLIDALKVHKEGNVCELDASGKSNEQVVDEILDLLGSYGACRVGVVDWLGKLENEGLLDEFLRI